MSDRRRILVVPKWYPWPELPVFGQFCREHARALATRHDIVVLASLATRSPGFPAYRLEDAHEEGIRTLRVRYRRPRFLRPAALCFQLAGMYDALGRLRKEGWVPDVVHAHVYQAGFPALTLCRRSRAPLVITEHYTGLQRGLVTGYERWIARTAFEGAAFVAPVSEELAGHVREIAPKATIEVLPNTVDTSVFVPGDGEPSDPPRLLTVGALAEKKGQRYLLDAMASLPGVELDLVGGGELDHELRAQSERLGMTDRVRFHGELPKEAVAGLMRGADLFVLPSTHETFGAVLIEAMASGLPSVATAVGGVPEVLDAQAGTLVPARDPAALAEAISAALERRGSVDRLALARAAEERYGYDAFAARWTDAYDRLL